MDSAETFINFHRFNCSSEITSFLRKMKNIPSSRNPFSNRGVGFYTGLNSTKDETSCPFQLLNRSLVIAERFGNHIVDHCYFNVGFLATSDFHQMKFYLIFRNFLALMPNLKRLTIFQWKIDLHKKIREQVQYECATVRELIAREPLPVLGHLEIVKIQGEGICGCSFYELLSKCPNLKMWQDPKGNFGFRILKNVQTSLKQGPLTVQEQFTKFEGKFRSERELLTLELFRWPNLTQVSLTIMELSAIDIETVFHTLNCFKSSLKILELDVRGTEKGGRSRSVLDLDLPNLEMFAFSYRISISLDFLWSMRSCLKEVKINFDKQIDNRIWRIETNAKVKIFSLLDKNCIDSKEYRIFWNNFPLLNTIKVFTRCCSWRECHRPDDLDASTYVTKQVQCADANKRMTLA